MTNDVERLVIPDYRKIHDSFIEIVAMRLHAIDQIKSGVLPPSSVTEGWRERYRGTPEKDLPPYMVEINHFKYEVDNFVAMLMQAVQKEHDERISGFGDTGCYKITEV